MAPERLPLVPHDAAQTLAAAGIAPLKAKLPAEERTVPVAARAYPHPGLDGKIIVRIESEAVAEGIDAEMAAFGFEAPKVSSPLGLTRYRTLGFPAWGLVNVPKTAKVALGVMEDVRKAKRMVAAKPGHAKEAFEKIAKTLQKASPMLLPSFWEEVGRTVADLASASMAAQCFERARQAERAFKLKVDADDCDSVFVEFALLGALSAKSLSQYAKDLVKAEGGATAYKRFRAIAVKRALGGMPPWSGMGKDIRSLAKDADLDVDKEDESLVAELLEAPAINKAPMEFWTTYRDAMIRLAKRDEAVRNRLRHLWPEPSGGRREDRGARREAWVQMLDEIGALSNLPESQGAELGAWVSKLINYTGATARVIELLKELAPRLASQPIAVITARGRWGTGLNLDLTETVLGLGIALVDPEADFFPESMTCDPVLVAAHPTYGPKLVEAVAEIIGEAEHEHRMRGKKGFDAARRAWVEERLKTLAEHSLACSPGNLDTIESKTTAETFLAFPDLWERLKATDLSAPLATLLRGGIADEFGWQAYEDAFAKLGGEIHLDGAFPNLVLWNASKAVALDAKGVVAEHDLVYKAKDHEVEHVMYLDGQFFVTLSPTKGWQRVSYWSEKPKELFEERALGEFLVTTKCADGSITFSGEKSFRAGDKEHGGVNHLFVEGARVWKYDYRAPKGQLHELDPIKGSKIGNSLPAFLSAPPPSDKGEWTLDLYHSKLHQVPDGLAASPLGVKDGHAGMCIWWHRDDDGRHYTCKRIDGITRDCDNQPEALVTFPGNPVPVRAGSDDSASSARFAGGSGPRIDLYGDDEHEVGVNVQEFAARGWGVVHVPPLLFWHFLAPRDEAGSKVLRAVTTEQARELLTAARGELTGDASGRPLPNTQAKIRALGITNDKLVRGVAGIVELAAEQAVRLETIAAERSKENADAGGANLTGDGQKLRKLLMAIHGGRTMKLADCDIDPSDWLENGRKNAVESLLPFADADQRRKVRDMLLALAATPFGDDVSQLRILKISEPDDWSDPEDWNTVVISKQDGSVFAVHGSDNWAIEMSTDGQWRTPKPWNIEEATQLKTPVGSAWCQAFATLPDAPVAWDPQFAVKLAEIAGLTVPEATLLYCGIPTGWRKDFLGKQKRDLVGLKMSEADAARTTFQELDADAKTALFAKAVPDDATLLATPLAPDGYVERLGKAWKAKYGKRAKIPQDLVAAAKKDLSLGNDLAKYLPVFAGGVDDAVFLKPDLRPFNELGGWGNDKGMTWMTGKELATLIAWLFIARPIGCPIRAGIPAVVKSLVKCVEDPKVIWKLDDYYFADDDKGKKLRDQVFDLVGGKSIELPKAGETACKQGRDDGTIVIGEYDSTIESGFRPAKLGGAATKKVETLALALWDKDNGGEPEAQLELIRVGELLRSDGFAAFAERVADTEVEDGKFEADPRQSVPKLVAKVAKATGLSNDGATLYLQILALAEPTERNVQAWNGWTAKQYKTVAAELIKKKLVIEGKRERAGRSIFLKGGYSKGGKQDLPMEDWKQAFYTSVLDRHVPHEPVHLLFARAWKRIEDGDKPA